MILVATVIATYSTIRTSLIRDQPQVLSAIDETNLAIKQILGFTVGYYGSVLQVTGNNSYAKMLALKYLDSGLQNIANMHPQWGTSFKTIACQLYTEWFASRSSSTADLKMAYNITGLGIYGVTYETSCLLRTNIMNTTANQARLNVTQDDNEPIIHLGKKNFKFYRYGVTNATWAKVNPSTEPTSFANGTYLIDIPSGVDPYSYLLQIEDPRGIIIVASSFSKYVCTLGWNATFYSSLRGENLIVELLQNGTARWLGQNLGFTTQTKPIPPVPVKLIRLNQTVNGTNREVPFQVEEWGSEYRTPISMASNLSVVSGRTMIVFLTNANVSQTTLWWKGNDSSIQTWYAYRNQYFTQDDPSNGILTNGKLRLSLAGGNWLTSQVGTFSAKADFMRINSKTPTYGSNLAYIIHHGVIRDIIHQEAEWGGNPGGIPNCPNVYSQLVITLPANVTYYTYQLRLMFVQSQQNRSIIGLCPIKLSSTIGQPQTENGTSSGYPIVVNGTGLFYNYSASYWKHHWSQMISGTKGFGIMFTDDANRKLYAFDPIAAKTGALKANATDRTIQLLPVERAPTPFTYALDVIWYGAVLTFDGNMPVYKQAGATKTGLWITVEYPPTIAVTTQS